MANETPHTYIIKHDGKRCIAALGLSKVIVGAENPDAEPEVVQVYSDADGRMMNKGRIKVEPREIYDTQKQKRKNWFILDLETGRHSNGKSWFPGSVVRASVVGERIPLRSEPREDAPIIDELSDSIVELVEERHLPVGQPDE